MFRIEQRRGLRVAFTLLFADVRSAQNPQALGIRGHHAVFNAVVNLLHKMPGTARTQ
jgi:hypothetical protein